MNRIARGLAVTVLAGAVGMTLGAAPAMAGSSTGDRVVRGDASASYGQLVLAPTDRGYQGTLKVTVKNQGTDAGNFRLRFQEPVAGSFRQTSPEQFCQTTVGSTAHRSTYECFLSSLAPKASLAIDITFQVLTQTRAYAMEADGGRIAISDGSSLDTPFSRSGEFQTLFRSTTGSLRNPRAYSQDKLAKSSIVVGDEVTMTREPNGRFTGRVQATVRYDGDAAHDYLWLDTFVAGGDAILVATDPADTPCGGSCQVPGGKFMQGEQRTFDLIFDAPANAAPGSYEATGSLSAQWQHGSVPEKDASDNGFSFEIVIPAAPKLSVSATDLVYAPVDADGFRRGTSTVTITNTGNTTVSYPMVTFPRNDRDVAEHGAWTECPIGLGFPDRLVCIEKPLGPGERRSVDFPFYAQSDGPAGPATVRVDAGLDTDGNALPDSGDEATYQVSFAS